MYGFPRGARGVFAGSQGRRNFHSQPGQRFFGFLAPIRAAETLRGNGVPAARFPDVPGFFFDHAQLPRHHAVAGALEELVEFRRRVRAVFRLADARLYLPPICHFQAL